MGFTLWNWWFAVRLVDFGLFRGRFAYFCIYLEFTLFNVSNCPTLSMEIELLTMATVKPHNDMEISSGHGLFSLHPMAIKSQKVKVKPWNRAFPSKWRSTETHQLPMRTVRPKSTCWRSAKISNALTEAAMSCSFGTSWDSKWKIHEDTWRY